MDPTPISAHAAKRLDVRYPRIMDALGGPGDQRQCGHALRSEFGVESDVSPD